LGYSAFTISYLAKYHHRNKDAKMAEHFDNLTTEHFSHINMHITTDRHNCTWHLISVYISQCTLTSLSRMTSFMCTTPWQMSFSTCLFLPLERICHDRIQRLLKQHCVSILIKIYQRHKAYQVKAMLSVSLEFG